MSQGGDVSSPAAIRNSIDALMCDIAQLRGEVARLRAGNEALRAENAGLAGDAALRRRTRRCGRERGAPGGERRASASTGPGQFEQLQAAVERRAEEEAAHPRQPSRALGQEKRRAGGTQGRHAPAGRRARSGRAARGAGVPALSGGADGFDAAGRGEAAGVRSARAADRGHRTSGRGLLLRRRAAERRKPSFPRASPRRRNTGSASGRRRSISTSISSFPRIGSPKR